MDPNHIRCKDLRPRIPDALERLRKAQPSTDPNSAVAAWIDDLLTEFPPVQTPGRHPLQEIQQPGVTQRSNLGVSHAQKSRENQRPHCIPWTMGEKKTQSPAKRGRGRPRGQGRGGRDIAVDHALSVHPFGHDGSKDSADEGITSEEGGGIGDVAAALVLRPKESLLSSSGVSPTRSPTRSKAASAVVKKSQLALMTPAILFVGHDMATERGGLPPVVEGLWRNHIFHTLSRSDFIPPGLKPRLATLFDTPRKSKPTLNSDLFSSSNVFNNTDLELIWMTLSDINYMTTEFRNTAPESHWIGTVVAPLLHLIRRLSMFKAASDRDRPLLAVLDITTTEISPQSLCPYTEDPKLYRDLDKRVDYAVGLRLTPQETDLLQRGQFAEYYPTSINQTASFANLTPLFINIEVKKRHVDRDPMIQLAAWIAAEFNKRRAEGYSLDMPVFAIEIDGDFWELHIAYAENPLAVDDYRLNFLGPFDMGHTKTYQGMFRILDMLCCLARWGLGAYREWVEKEILSKYKPASQV